jgi:hypothetical protein
MLAKELVTIIEEYNPDWTRQGILNEIEYIQRMMYAHPTMLSRAFSEDATGVTDPQFTVDVNNQVVLEDADGKPLCFRIEKVYQSDPTCPLDTKNQGNVIRFVDSLVGTNVRVRYYKQSTTDMAEGMALLVPDQFIDILEAGVTERLAFKEHRDRQPFQMWKKRELPAFWASVNKDFRFDEDEPSQSTNPYGV